MRTPITFCGPLPCFFRLLEQRNLWLAGTHIICTRLSHCLSVFDALYNWPMVA